MEGGDSCILAFSKRHKQILAVVRRTQLLALLPELFVSRRIGKPLKIRYLTDACSFNSKWGVLKTNAFPIIHQGTVKNTVCNLRAKVT
jgi:hypothetical protein